MNAAIQSVARCLAKTKNNGLFCDAAVTKPFNVSEVASYNNKSPYTPKKPEKETQEVYGGLSGRKCVKCNKV